MRRGELEIIVDLLSIAMRPTSKTHLLYGANLSYRQLVHYLSFLQAHKLIEKLDGETRLFRTSERGRKLLELLEPDAAGDREKTWNPLNYIG